MRVFFFLNFNRPILYSVLALFTNHFSNDDGMKTTCLQPNTLDCACNNEHYIIKLQNLNDVRTQKCYCDLT